MINIWPFCQSGAYQRVAVAHRTLQIPGHALWIRSVIPPSSLSLSCLIHNLVCCLLIHRPEHIFFCIGPSPENLILSLHVWSISIILSFPVHHRRLFDHLRCHEHNCLTRLSGRLRFGRQTQVEDEANRSVNSCAEQIKSAWPWAGFAILPM